MFKPSYWWKALAILSNRSLAMNLGILERLQAHGTNCDTTCMAMLPGNHKDELPLIHFVPTLPHHFCCPVFVLIYLLFLFLSSLPILNFLPPHRSFSNRLRQVHCFLWPEIYYFLSQKPNLQGLHYPVKPGQCTTAHSPGAYQGINCVKLIACIKLSACECACAVHRSSLRKLKLPNICRVKYPFECLPLYHSTHTLSR